jgi:hypothetical protein
MECGLKGVKLGGWRCAMAVGGGRGVSKHEFETWHVSKVHVSNALAQAREFVFGLPWATWDIYDALFKECRGNENNHMIQCLHLPIFEPQVEDPKSKSFYHFESSF